MPDLFDPSRPEEPIRGKHYVRPNGYAKPPGSGPEGETCGSCFAYHSISYHRKSYPKCELNRHNWTHGRGSDILKSAPACSLWRKKDGNTST